MADASSSLWPIVVGGLLALGGTAIGVIGSIFVAFFQTATDKKKRRAEKIEELVAALFEHKHWLEVARAIRVVGREGQEAVSPFSRVEAITTVYFPNFQTSISELSIIVMEYEMWMLVAGQRRLKQDASFTERHNEAVAPYSKKFQQVISEIKDYARNEFQ